MKITVIFHAAATNYSSLQIIMWISEMRKIYLYTLFLAFPTNFIYSTEMSALITNNKKQNNGG
jgi:hypothetical protein